MSEPGTKVNEKLKFFFLAVQGVIFDIDDEPSQDPIFGHYPYDSCFVRPVGRSVPVDKGELQTEKG